MKLTVRFLGSHRSIVGKGSIDLDIGAGKKIGDLIKEIPDYVAKPELEKMLIDPELVDPRPGNVILVNGREINSLDGLDTELHDGDEIVLIPLIHGG